MGITIQKKDKRLLELTRAWQNIQHEESRIVAKQKREIKYCHNINDKALKRQKKRILKECHNANNVALLRQKLQRKKHKAVKIIYKTVGNICNVSREITDGMICKNGVVLCTTDNYYNQQRKEG